MDTLAYWVVQQHKRFISTNTCSFNLHLAYRSPDHYYNIFFTNELKRSSVIPMHSVPVPRGAIFKIGSISNLSIIKISWYWSEFLHEKGILQKLVIFWDIFPTFSYSSIIIFEKMDTVIRVYSLFLLFYRTQNFIIWVEYIIGRSVDTSLKKLRYFEFW